MTTAVDLCNRALSHLGTQSQIQSLTEVSTEALHASIHYDAMRQDLLRLYNWGFARAQVSLALLKAQLGTQENPAGTLPQPPIPWLYEYGKPSDCIRERRILPLVPPLTTNPPLTGVGSLVGVPLPMGPPVKFTPAVDTDINGNNIAVILTNQQQAVLIYTRNLTDPNLFDPLFQTALVGRLAAALVIPLSGDKALAKIAIEDGQKAEQDAAAVDGQEGLTIINSTPDWLRGRGLAADFGDEIPTSLSGPLGYPWYFDG